MEFEEQARQRLQPLQLRIRDAGLHLHLVQQFHARDRDARLHDGDHRLDRAAQRGELAGGGRHRLGDAVQAQLDLGDDAERALGADEQPRQVVAGGGLAHAAAGVDQPPVGQRHGQPQHVLADRAVAHRVGAGGARRAHPADRAQRRAGIDREEQALVAQVLVELIARDAGLDAAVHVGLADLDDAGHARQVERDAAAHRRHVAFQRGAGAPGHHRHVRGVAQRQQPRGLVRGLDEGDRVGQHRRLGVLAVRVVLAQRGVGGDALAQEVAGGGDHGIDGFGHRGTSGVGPAP